MDSYNELYTIKSNTKPEPHLQQTEETLLIIVAMLDSLQHEAKKQHGNTTYYLKAINNLVQQAFDIYDCLYKINAQEAQFYRHEHPIFSLNQTLTTERLNNYLCSTLYQLGALTDSAIDDGMLTRLSVSSGNILISLSLYVKQLIQLVEHLSNFEQLSICRP